MYYFIISVLFFLFLMLYFKTEFFSRDLNFIIKMYFCHGENVNENCSHINKRLINVFVLHLNRLDLRNNLHVNFVNEICECVSHNKLLLVTM